MNAPRPACIIFDLDGTLLDTEVLYTRSAEIVCARHGVEFTLELKRLVMGGGAVDGARQVIERLGLPLSPEAYLAERERELLALLPSTRPMRGAEALVAGLSARGVPLAIATSGQRAITTFKLSHQPFLSAVGPVVCGDDPRLARAKPAPDIFLLAARELGADPRDCVVIEDSLNGVRAGIAAGMRTIALVDPRWGFERSAFAGATRIIDSLEELTPELLGASA